MTEKWIEITALLPTCKYEKCLFMFGSGSNGKSTVLNVLESIIGSDHTSALSIDDMGHRFNIPFLQNKMINIAAEVEGRDQRGTENFKKAVSGDLISGEHKHGSRVQFRNRAKFIFAMNNPSATLVLEADRMDRYGLESLKRYKALFGMGYLAGNQLEEAKKTRQNGLKDWFKTPTAIALATKLAREMGWI